MNTRRPALLAALLLVAAPAAPAAGPDPVAARLAQAGANRPELEKALAAVPPAERAGMEFVVAHMPDADLAALTADFLVANHALAYRARREMPWAKAVPDDVFLNDVLPYAHVDEKREPWRAGFFDRCAPLVKDCKTASDAARKLNAELFPLLKLKYSPARRAANQPASESMASGKASCTGLSIVLAHACRSVGVPARLAGTANWHDDRGNHTWVEVWDGGTWHFAGAAEPDPAGLDRGWFAADAARATKGDPGHAIYAASFRRTGDHFPLVWDRRAKTVHGVDVTDRYADPKAKKPATARVSVRVVDAAGKRVARAVTVTCADCGTVLKGTSRGDGADLNDFLGFDLRPGMPYVAKVGAVDKQFTAGPAGGTQVVTVTAAALTSPDALAALTAALAAKPESLADLSDKAFAAVPLTKADAAAARVLLWDAHVARLKVDRAKELADKVLTDGKLAMPFAAATFGKRPPGGHSLWISLHGGGNAPKRVNDQQWQNQKKLYALDEGVYVAPRAPTDTWNLWHEPHVDRLFARLIEDMVAVEGVDPDRVYVVGYSAGGDGVYQLAPRLADRWAGAGMMAGHPNGVSPLSLRNVPFALQVGANDAAYNRNTVAKDYGDQLAALQKADPDGYKHLVKIHDGKGHWMGGEDKLALPWLAKSSRDPVPARVVWKQTGTVHDRSYWLAVPPGEGKPDTLVTARRDGQTVNVTAAESVPTLLVRFDDRMLDLDKPVTVTHAGKELYRGTPARTVGVMLRTLAGRGDPKLVFDAEVRVTLPAAK